VGGTPGVGGADLGGADSGGSDSGGNASTGGASTGGGSTGGASSAGGSGGSGASASGGSGGSGGTTTILTVTTDQDEEDAGATPASPGQTGFSFREAILYANAEPDHHEINFQGQYTINLTQPLPTITKTARVIGAVGPAAAAIDGTSAGASAPCLSVDASDVVIDELWIFDCQAEPVAFESGSGNTFTNSLIVNAALPGTFYGDGPVILFNYWDSMDAGAIHVYATNAQVLANRIDDAVGTGIVVDDAANGAFLLANVLIRPGAGIELGATNVATLWHNTVVDSGAEGVTFNDTSIIDFRNNIVTGSATFGVASVSGQFNFFDYNLYFDNTSGNCSSCSLGVNDLTQDPLYVNPGADDFAPQPTSPAVDSGFDTGDDRNLELPGLFNGTGPDRGFIETQ